MATFDMEPTTPDVASDSSQGLDMQEVTSADVIQTPIEATGNTNGDISVPATPTKGTQKPLPKEPAMTPRIKKRIPWKGKNILVLVPRDDERGLPGMSPKPLNQAEIDRMFSSWRELGYSVDGFDLLVEGYQVPGTDDAQSRDLWPDTDDMNRERAQRQYKVTLPERNAWQNYVDELQEAKLRALGVSSADEEPAPSPITNPSRQASAQYPPLPFSPPLPTTSAASSHALPGFPFPGQFHPGSSAAQSPGIPSGASPVPFGAPGKFNPRQSISFPASNSPFQFPQQSPQGWMQGMNRVDSPNYHGILSPSSPYGIDGFQQAGSPTLNMHQRHQSLQYMPQQQTARASPRLQEVREDEEEEINRSPSKTPEPANQNSGPLQAEIDDAEYHLEEQFRNQFEHEDYNPDAPAENGTKPFAPSHNRAASGSFATSEHFANEPSKPLVLHHPRPHSRGQSLSQTFFQDHELQGAADTNKLGPLKETSESQKDDESHEVETNPSNLGTPVQNFDFAAAFNHQKTMSTASNPWQAATSVAASGGQHSSHSSKPSLSKLNVKAPEFKFNPTSSFTPGLYNFSSTNFQPAVFPATTHSVVESPPGQSMPQFNMPSKINVNAPAFSPGQSDFSFSASGPKFRPDAPSFTPFQALSDSVASPMMSGNESGSRRTDSIFGNIDILECDIVKPGKKSKAVPIVKPASRTSAASPRMLTPGDDAHEGSDGRLTDDSRVKRTRSVAPDGDEVPLFAERPDYSTEQVETGDNHEHSGAEDGSVAEDNTLPVDTSISSIVTSDQMDTKATTAAPSETSPIGQTSNWSPFEFESKFDGQTFNDALPFGEHEPVHKKSLSAKAQPFTPGGMTAGDKEKAAEAINEPSAESTIVAPVAPTSAPAAEVFRPKLAPKSLAKPRGLAASRFATTPSPVQKQQTPPPPPLAVETKSDKVVESVEQELVAEPVAESVPEIEHVPELEPEAESLLPSVEASTESLSRDDREPTFEEIDAVMKHFEADPSMSVNKALTSTKEAAAATTSSPSDDLQLPTDQLTREGTSTTPRQFHALADTSAVLMPSTEVDDPFVDPPLSPPSPELINELGEPEIESVMASDWEGAFTEDEHDKLENRAQFFDGRVNEVVGTLLASRLEPMEKALFSIQNALASKSSQTRPSREMRSGSAEFQESDADDEDEEPVPRRSSSPRRDRRMEQIRVAVTEAIAAQHRIQQGDAVAKDGSAVMKALEEMREQFSMSMKAGSRGGDLIDLTETPAEDETAPSSKPDDLRILMDDFQGKVTGLQQRLESEQSKMEKEITERRAAEDAAAELDRKLQAAETRIEVEIINRSVYDQRVVDLEERLRHHEELSERETMARRAAEDRLAEVQRLHRIASEEEDRLREVVEEKDQKMKTLEQSSSKNSMRMVLLEAAQNNNAQSQSEMANKANTLEADLRAVRQDNNHWRAEAEHADELARRKGGELGHVLEENKVFQRTLHALQAQLEENERLRESWRGKFMSLQDDMGQAARDVAEENARRIKKDQAMIARQEVLDARLQAEAKTRERLEVELDRLQDNERSGMRAVNECNRLEALLTEMRTDNTKLQQSASHFKREFEEARESGASEVKRTRMALQTELDSANNQVNVIRVELEEQNTKLRSELDGVKLDSDTVKAQNEMLLEEAQTSKATALEEMEDKHRNEFEDMQTRYERQVNNGAEDAQKAEQNLLERLSLSTSKIEHLQDRIVHLEDKLEVTKEAAAAAAQAAKSAGVDPGLAAAAVQARPSPTARKLELPEKISPQALRESIMVLQEQLQAREQRIEELEHVVAKSDPDAASKISKRDDEISWLRELLAVRHSDLQDVITALSSDDHDREALKDATIRLRANLQMEQQERERAMNGGSAINLPNIAQSIQAAAASPRVAQTIGPIAAAWGNWRKGSQPSFRSISGVLGSPAGSNNATPSKSRSSPAQPGSLLGGLMTPPASGLRQTPTTTDDRPQPTAFSSTGRRFTSQGSMPNRGRRESNTSHLSDKKPARDATPPQRQEREDPITPPMISDNTYDEDAQPGDFDDHDFFEEEEED